MDTPEDAAPVDGKNLSEQERKKLRNRLSQRAFRRRQAEQIRDLQSRVDVGRRPDSEVIEALQRENRILRQQLLDVQAKMSRIMASMQTLNDSVSETLDKAPGEPEQAPAAWQTSSSFDPEYVDTLAADLSTDQVSVAPPLPPHASSSASSSGVQRYGTTSSEMTGSVVCANPLSTHIPDIWNFEYQMGMQPYMSAINSTEESRLILGKDWASSNSPFSDHISSLQQLLRNKLDLAHCSDGQLSTHSLYQPVLMVLSMFNSMTRPDVMAWYAKTRFYHIIELTAWQLMPSAATFEKLHPRYRPTETQQAQVHPGVIDWIPFPAIRDRLIRLHAANPHIDQIFCDALTAYVVEAPMSDLVMGAPRITIYLRVTDLVTAMAAGTSAVRSGGGDNAVATLPAPDVATLFSSPAHALAAFKQLNMDKGAGYYKIDPAFFQQYPELYDPSASNLTATGIPLKPHFQKVLTYPKPLDTTTFETYRSFIDFSLDAADSISRVSVCD